MNVAVGLYAWYVAGAGIVVGAALGAALADRWPLVILLGFVIMGGARYLYARKADREDH